MRWVSLTRVCQNFSTLNILRAVIYAIRSEEINIYDDSFRNVLGYFSFDNLSSAVSHRLLSLLKTQRHKILDIPP